MGKDSIIPSGPSPRPSLGNQPDTVGMYASTGYPVGAPLIQAQFVRGESVVEVDGEPPIAFDITGKRLSDGKVEGNVGAVVKNTFLAVFEPGWHRVSVTPPDGWSCEATNRFELPGDASAAQYVRTDRGTVTHTHFSCPPISP